MAIIWIDRYKVLVLIKLKVELKVYPFSLGTFLFILLTFAHPISVINSIAYSFNQEEIENIFFRIASYTSLGD